MNAQTLVTLLAICLVGAQAHVAGAAEFKSVSVQNPWARATIGKGRVGVAYMTLRNTGTRADRLTGASTPVAGRASLHSHRMDGNVMRMRPVEAIAVPAGGRVMLEPGGLHIMLFSLARPLKRGERFSLTLRFEHAGEITVEATVQGVAARSHGG